LSKSPSPCGVVLITGFLGAGKTTLLRNILQWPGDLSGTAALVNEFGSVGIDGELLKDLKAPIIELSNGCICCTMQGDLLKSVDETLRTYHPSRLLIEATGVADPFEILNFLNPSRLDGRISSPRVVTVVNADLWEGREMFGRLFYEQIKAAELILFNQVDYLPEEDIPRCLEEVRQINSSCAVLPTHYCRIDPDVFWKAAGGPAHGGEFTFAPLVHLSDGSAPELGYVSFAVEHEKPFRESCFRTFVKSMPIELYRMKGFVHLDTGCFMVNHVGGRTEWRALEERCPTRLAFVGWKVEKDQVEKVLKACL